MKKSLFFAAAVSALMLTACSSENDVVQSAPQTQETAAKALDFDVYMPQAVTRAGDPAGVMTTDKLKFSGKGFGVFAFHHDNAGYTTSLTPNFMYNEHVSWSGGWSYSPLKYWPNETQKDSQTGPATSTDTPANRLDKLSFFAYAPYVSTGTSFTLDTKAENMELNRTSSSKISAYEKSETSGILRISSETYAGDPKIEWGFSSDLDNNVDLLWGVAPAGMNYQTVNPDLYQTNTFGFPLKDQVKPDKDQKIKFLFQHALSRIGLSVVSAIDQIAAGDDGNKFNSAETRVLIEEVNVWGDFGIQGVLNLNNTVKANQANWEEASILPSTSNATTPLFTFDNGTVPAPGTANGYIAKILRYEDSQITAVNGDASKFAELNTGVLPSETVLLSGGADPSKLATGDALNYAFGKALYKLDGSDYVRATTTPSADANIYTVDASGNYTQVHKSGVGTLSMDGTVHYYKITATSNQTVDGTTALASGTYYTVSGTEGEVDSKYNKYESNGTDNAPAGTYYSLTWEEVTGAAYTGTLYTSLMPRYFMVIPSKLSPATPTNIGIRIKYHVVTKDTKLQGNISNVTNEITKETSIQLESGKSYNLKLILGLTSVKLDATVADWQVGDDAEVWLPKNNE